MLKIRYNSPIYPLLQVKDKYLFKKILQYLKPQKEDKILEIGCGRGFLVKEMQEFNPNTCGIDINPEAIKNGVAKNLKAMDATKLDFSSDCFDKIYSCHTIEHIPNTEKLLQEIWRVLKPGGRVFLVYPYEIIRGTGAIMASLIMFGNMFYSRKIHIHKFSPSKIKKLLKNTQLVHIKSSFSLFQFPQYFTLLGKKKN